MMAGNTEMAEADVFGNTTLPDKLEVSRLIVNRSFLSRMTLFYCL